MKKLIGILSLSMLLLALAFLLAGCPDTAPGYLELFVDARNTTRCDNGIKVELVGVQEGWLEEGGERSENDTIYGAGDYWIWVKRGHHTVASWRTLYGLNNYADGRLIVIRAYCMRNSGEPGVSERVFNAASLLHGDIVDTAFDIKDSGADPDYTLAPPGLTIELNR